MTDGPTGIPVAPESMEDATMAKLFRRAAQAIVDASEYPNIVKDLQGQVEALRSELDRKSTHASQLDQSLAEVRQERDNLRLKVEDQERMLDRSTRQAGDDNRTIHELQDKLHFTEQALDYVKTERDDYGMKLLHAEEQVADWKDKANQARDRLNEILGMFKESEPELTFIAGPDNEVVKATDIPPAEPSPAPVQEPTPEPEKPWWVEDKAAQPTSAPAEPPTEWSDTWQEGFVYDPTAGRYKRALPF